MGNSNSRVKNYKIFKIVSRDFNDSFIRIHLDDYVNYRDGKRKQIDFKKTFFSEQALSYYWPGEYIKINLEKTQDEHASHDFDFFTDVMKTVRERVVEDSNGNKFICDTLEFFDEIGRNRERYQASIIDARNSNYTNLRQTSYDMPPKW